MMRLNDDCLSFFSRDLLFLSRRKQWRVSARDLASYPLTYKLNQTSHAMKEASQFLNDLSRWTEVLVLSCWDAVDRGKMLSFLIHLADRSRQIHSYFIAIGVVMGLLSSHVQRSVTSSLDRFPFPVVVISSFYPHRLPASWSHVDSATSALFLDLKELFSAVGNFSAYRKVIAHLDQSTLASSSGELA
jgi:hypothetical protein